MAMRHSVTFVLPGRNRAGGTRITVDLANELHRRGHCVRLALSRSTAGGPRQLGRLLFRQLRRLYGKFGGQLHDDWVRQFVGVTEEYSQLDDLHFQPGEVVVAVGSFTVGDVRSLGKNVVKIRYCHGFQVGQPEEMARVWGGDMTTITAASTMVPFLERYSGRSVRAVIPSAIHRSEYFAENGVIRDGIGTIYSSHHNKAPEFTIEVLSEIRRCWPGVPQYIFGTESRPPGLRRATYTRLPSVELSRRIYSQCKVWLLTSRFECLPAPVMEAWACGAAVVSTDNLGGLELIRHDENGLLVPFGNVAAMTQAVGALLSNEPRRQELLTEGRRTLDRFTWVRAADMFEQLVHELTSVEVREVRQ